MSHVRHSGKVVKIILKNPRSQNCPKNGAEVVNMVLNIAYNTDSSYFCIMYVDNFKLKKNSRVKNIKLVLLLTKMLLISKDNFIITCMIIMLGM